MKQNDSGVKWFVTDYYPSHRTGRAVHMEGKNGILDRLSRKEITFFTPLGPRYDWEKRGIKVLLDDAEARLLRFLKQNVYMPMEVLFSRKDFKWIFLGADSYGSNINNLPSDVVRNYFLEMGNLVKTIFPNPKVSFELWSSYEELAMPYKEKVQLDIAKYVPSHIRSNAKSVAEKMGLGGNHSEYLVERVAEALLIDDLYHPIKISCVARYKDDYVDVNLPRLYLVPSSNHAPWMGKH